jgi:hypothetical protein
MDGGLCDGVASEEWECRTKSQVGGWQLFDEVIITRSRSRDSRVLRVGPGNNEKVVLVLYVNLRLMGAVTIL